MEDIQKSSDDGEGWNISREVEEILDSLNVTIHNSFYGVMMY